MISLLHDQRFSGAPLLNFMGHPAHTSLGTAEIALKYNIPIIPIYVTRIDEKSQFTLQIDAPISLASPKEMSQEMNDNLGQKIRVSPEQWYWFHKRWHIYDRK